MQREEEARMKPLTRKMLDTGVSGGPAIQHRRDLGILHTDESRQLAVVDAVQGLLTQRMVIADESESGNEDTIDSTADRRDTGVGDDTVATHPHRAALSEAYQQKRGPRLWI
ncbi:uncharacterized protein EKO05_0007795 [Ascochyta rabiei]|nr:uncharacterized protein EKO05_0007795 [Ascochyta rabiei]UPX17441.1 hypothetical protein EKO05_0007795 [Ascochyta rabiei]